MKNLSSIWPNIKPGNIVLFQHSPKEGVFKKPELVIIVGIDVWDMAMAVYYTNYKDFLDKDLKGGVPEVYSFAEWGEEWNVLGHWKTMPKYKNLLKAYRKKK